jgi:hypothetical protein
VCTKTQGRRVFLGVIFAREHRRGHEKATLLALPVRGCMTVENKGFNQTVRV